MCNSLKFGVVIPLFNTERYIIESLMSIVDQGYNNIEIVVVDDGSTDSGLRLVQEFSKTKTIPIHIIESSHQGVSRARNLGIEKLRNLQCDYVLFLDSDDLLKGDIFNCINDICQKREEKIDLFLLKQMNFYKNTNLNQTLSVSGNEEINFRELLRLYFRGARYKNSQYSSKGAANKVFSISILKDKYFDEKLPVCEDQIFFLSVIYGRNHKLTTLLLGSGAYFYRQRKASLTHSDNRSSLQSAYYAYWNLYKNFFYSYDKDGLFLREVCWWFKNALKNLPDLERKMFYRKEVRKLRAECFKREFSIKQKYFLFIVKTFLPYKYFSGFFKRTEKDSQSNFLFD